MKEDSKFGNVNKMD